MSRGSAHFQPSSKRQRVQEAVERFGLEFDELDPMLKAEVVFWSDPEDIKALCSVSRSYARFCRSPEMDAVWKQKIAAARGAPVRYNTTLEQVAPGAQSWIEAWLYNVSAGPLLLQLEERLGSAQLRNIEVSTANADVPITRQRIVSAFRDMYDWFAAHGAAAVARDALQAFNVQMIEPPSQWDDLAMAIQYTDVPFQLDAALRQALFAGAGCDDDAPECTVQLPNDVKMQYLVDETKFGLIFTISNEWQ